MAFIALLAAFRDIGRLRAAAGAVRRRPAGVGLVLRARRRRPTLASARLLAASALGLAVTRAAHAAELSARGPALCPDAAELAFRVERAIGMPLAQAAPLRFSVVFERAGTPPAYVAELGVQGRGEAAVAAARRFTGEDCGRLGDAVSVAIALALGTRVDEEAERPDAQTAAPSPALPAAAPPERAAGVPSGGAARAGDPEPRDGDAVPPGAPSPAAAWAPALGAALLFDSGSLPAPGWGIELGAELRGPRLALRAAGTWLFDQYGTVSAGAGAELGLALGSVSVCTLPLGPAQAPWAAAICGGWELGRLEGSGRGVPAPRRAGALWTAPRLGAELSWSPSPSGGPWRLGAQLVAAAPLQRDEFFLRDIGTVHRPPAALVRLGVGVAIRFE